MQQTHIDMLNTCVHARSCMYITTFYSCLVGVVAFALFSVPPIDLIGRLDPATDGEKIRRRKTPQ